MYPRLLKNEITKKLFKGKAIIILGARQTGKTTLATKIISEFKNKKTTRIFNCDNPLEREFLNNKDMESLEKLLGNYDLVLIDEGQKVETIGQTLKLLVDRFKRKKQFIVTGSSSFNLLDKTGEALTGRKYVLKLFPISIEEMHPDKDPLKIAKELENYLIFGGYPEILGQKSFNDKLDLLSEIFSSYLYKDILEFQQIKSPESLLSLLKALALQIGSEVSYNELSRTVGIDKNTVEKYINLLSKNFIIFRLSPYTRNKRREIAKLKKVYFYDLGIRNAIISNFNPLSDRNDVGKMWENFVISERLKYQAYHKVYSNNYFWRTYDGSEVDWVEERGGKLFGYEMKWKEHKKTLSPQKWKDYPESEYKIISPEKINNFIL